MRTATARFCWRGLATLICGLFLAATLSADVGAVIAVAGDPPDEAAGNPGDVYVRDSAVAMEKLALARRMETAHEWGKSADLYQEILQKYPDRVAPSAYDSHQRVTQYTSVTETVRQSICKWPAEGLDVYRSRYETVAANLLAEADASGSATPDTSKLHQVFFFYFPTDSGKSAGIRLMDVYFEQGEFAAVCQIGRRLLNWHPNLDAERPMVLCRLVLAEKFVGETDLAARDAEQIASRFPNATGTLRGEDVILADFVKKELAVPTTQAQPTVGDSWLTVGGDNTRGKLSSSTLKPGARLYSLPLGSVRNFAADPRLRNPMIQQFDAQQQLVGSRLGVMPAVDRGEMFFQDNTSLYAVDLDSGVPLPGWSATWPGGVYKFPGSNNPLPNGHQLAVSINDKYVVAVMGLPDSLGFNFAGDPASPARLVCLDRHSGVQLWISGVQNLPDSQANLRGIQIGSAPLIVGDNVYVVGHGGKAQQFEDCYVLCFSLADGQLRWGSYIGSSAVQQQIIGPDGELVFSNYVSNIAYDGGRLYVVTDLGAAAALDAFSGSVLWLNIYRDQAALPAMQPFIGFNSRLAANPISTPPWTQNSAIVQNGRVFVCPGDSQSVFIYDADSGALIKRIQLLDLPETTESSRPGSLLAVDGDMLYLAGGNQAWRIPWPQYDAATNPIPAGGWASAPLSEPIRGRAFVAGDALYLPSASCLTRVLLKNGMFDPDGAFPKNNWDKDQEGPGNVIVTGDHVIVAGDKFVAVYADIEIARAKLDRQVGEHPDDPQPRLHYAEVMFVSNQSDLAEQKLQEAFARLGLSSGPAADASRNRAFADAMSFAARLQDKGGDPARTARFFDMAAQGARTPLQQVQFRLARAEFDQTQHGIPLAMDLYQQILADRAMRDVSVIDPENGGIQRGGALAEQAVASLLQIPAGQAAYEKYEQAAGVSLRSALTADDAAQLLELARVYPNSAAAQRALMSAATAYESSGNSRYAVRVLRKLLSRDLQSGRAAALEAMARNCLKIPGQLDIGVTRLAQAATLAPTDSLVHPLQLPDGSTFRDMSLAEASEAVRRAAAQIDKNSLPDFHLPTGEQRNAFTQRTHRTLSDPFDIGLILPGVQNLIVPSDGFTRGDRLITWNGTSGLEIFSTDQSTPLCACPQITSPPRAAAWLGDDLLVNSPDAIERIDSRSGQLRWKTSLDQLPAAAPLADSPPIPDATGPLQITEMMPAGDRVIIGTSHGLLAALDAVSGKLIWQSRVNRRDPDRLLASEDFVVFRFQDDQNFNLVALNAVTGELLGRKLFPIDNGPLINLALGADGLLAYTLPDRLCVLDLYDVDSSPQGMDTKIFSPPALETSQMFVGAGQPDQLILHGGRAFCVADQGRNVRIYSLVDARPWRYPSQGGEDQTDTPLVIDSRGSPNVALHISADTLFVFSSQNLRAYQIDHPWETWTIAESGLTTRNFSQMLFGRDYLLVVDRPRPPLTLTNRQGGRAVLCGFSRANIKPTDAESGAWVYRREIVDPDGILAWQPLEGGVAWFNGNSIHLLLGNRDHLQAQQ